jgi:hypothetical protein
MKIVQDRGGSRLSKKQQKQSLASLYLDADVGSEMSILLGAKDPVAIAGALHRRMGGDQSAIQGLKSAFMESMLGASFRGEAREFSAKAFRNMVDDNIKTARALGMDDAEITRLRTISQRLVQGQARATASKDLVEGPLMMIDFFTTLIGAKGGAKIAGGGVGSGIKMAAAGATVSQRLLKKFTQSSAMDLLEASMTDPVLYKALLTKVEAPLAVKNIQGKKIEDAIQLIEGWVAGIGISQTDKPEWKQLRHGSANAGATEQLNLDQ